MKKVALFTTFFEATSGYSLIGVTETQIQMLLDHHYEPVVLVQENFIEPDPPSIWRGEMIDLRPEIPFMHLEKGEHPDFEDRMSAIVFALEQNLKDVEVCITHDIILQEFYKEHNVAMRRYAKTRPDLLWLHWVHSVPTPGGVETYPNNSRYTSPPGYIVYPNSTDKGRVCSTYKLSGKEWKVQSSRSAHSIDPLLIWPYDKMTVELARSSDLLGGEVTAVYPARLDRGKQPEKIIYLMAGVQKAGYDPRLLIIDWQSSGKHFQTYIDQLLELASALGLEGKVNFTSRLHDGCSQGVERKVVSELMDLSNIYVHPSRVETYSLVVHEAILRGCLPVLNYDLRMMRELFGDNAIYMDFGSDQVNRNYGESEQEYWNGEATRLLAELRMNRAVMAKTTARREWTPQALWKDFEPLLHLRPVGE